MLNIYYFHGLASRFDTSSEKLKTLARLGSVRGHDIDYTQTAEEVVEDSLDKLMQVNPDFIVGTSMGGWLAGILGAETGIPFVAINPVGGGSVKVIESSHWQRIRSSGEEL